MDCILKIIAGPDAGREFRCTGQETLVGRSPQSGVRLASASVSYEHATIQRTGDEFFLENLSANGTYLNNERISGKVRLRPRDQVRIGEETVARVESLPSTAQAGAGRRYLLGGVVLLLIALLAVVVIDPFSGVAQQNQSRAYRVLDGWTLQAVQAGKLPGETTTMLQDAWRLEEAGDRTDARKAWTRLAIYLAGAPGARNLQENSTQIPHALQRLLDPDPRASSPAQSPPPVDDDEMGAALLQFVNLMEKKK